MDSTAAAEHTIALQRLRTIVLARWIGAVFMLFQVLAYQTMPYPDGIRAVALGIAGAFAVSNVGFEVLRRRDLSPGALRRLAIVVLVTDVLLASGITWVFAFDAVSALFAILFLLPIEGAVLFGLPGALWTWAGVAALYTGREWFGTRYGNPFEFESVTFRVGLIGIVGIIVGLLVRDLVRQRRETARALQEAEAANESRSRLISTLAHDVRSPIAGTRTAIDMLLHLDDAADEEQRTQLLQAGKRQADRALYLAADLLDLARFEADMLSVAIDRVELARVLQRTRDVLGDRATPDVDVADLAVMADADRLAQVVYNLLENAAKYGEPPVQVTAESRGEEVVLAIRDHGPGVPDSVDLFSAFSGEGEGSVGLGLWIAGHLVQAMGGAIEYDDAEPGARFVIRLPAAHPTGDATGEAMAASPDRVTGGASA